MNKNTAVTLILSLLLLTQTEAAQSPQGKQPDKPTSKATPDSASRPAPLDTVIPEKSVPARRFTPTERVAADDAVSFPVDI